MRTTARTILGLALAGALVAACGAAASTQAPAAATPAVVAPAAAAVTPPPTPKQITAPPATPSPTPMPTTDGKGDEVVSGEMMLNGGGLVQQYSSTQVGDVTQLRDGVAEFTATMNDPRVSGTVTFNFGLDLYTGAASEWGDMTVKNDKGAWTGTCTGGAWAAGEGVAWSCWLAGSGDYAGYSYYKQLNKEPSDTAAQVTGVVYSGPIPTGAP